VDEVFDSERNEDIEKIRWVGKRRKIEKERTGAKGKDEQGPRKSVRHARRRGKAESLVSTVRLGKIAREYSPLGVRLKAAIDGS